MRRKHKAYDANALRAGLATCFPSVVPCHTPTQHFYRRGDTGRVTASVTTKQSFVGKSYLKQWAVNVGLDHVRANKERLDGQFDAVLQEAKYAHTGSLEEAADIGTTAHNAFDRYLTAWREGNRPEGSSKELLKEGARGEEIAACRSFDLFLEENEVIPLASEVTVWYEQGKDCYAGSVDAVLLVREVHKDRVGADHCKAVAAVGSHDYERQESGMLWCVECGREVAEKLVLADHKTSNSIRDKDDYAQQSVAYAVAIEKALGGGVKFDDIWIIRYGKTRAEYEICRVTDRKASWKEFLSISRAFDEKQKRGENKLLEPLLVKEIIKI